MTSTRKGHVDDMNPAEPTDMELSQLIQAYEQSVQKHVTRFSEPDEPLEQRNEQATECMQEARSGCLLVVSAVTANS